jgi:hypothetical protein
MAVVGVQIQGVVAQVVQVVLLELMDLIILVLAEVLAEPMVAEEELIKAVLDTVLQTFHQAMVE